MHLKSGQFPRRLISFPQGPATVPARKTDPMRKDIRLHGEVADHIEYFATIAGSDAHQRYFFNVGQGENDELRFFSPGNEFQIGQDGIFHRGNGGSFCEYMFGVEQPSADLAKEEVLNRLIMYGASQEEENRGVSFSDQTEGTLGFERIFFDGNAVANYFFFINSPQLRRPVPSQQKTLLKHLGKAIKRSTAVGTQDDNAIIDALLGSLPAEGAQVFLFRLVNRRHREYHDTFKGLYLQNKKISDEDFAMLTDIAVRHGIDRYQQERIRIDVMYRHPVNQRIVDEYRGILIECNRRGEINRLENARLTRLKTLSVRNKIPAALLHTLDEMLRRDKKMVEAEENDYISETRQILEGLFLREREIDSSIDRDDMLKLLSAKRKAVENRDFAFEELLLDASRTCDEKIRDGADLALLEGLSSIITFFDRHDSTSSTINNLAFMENIRISEDMLRSLLGNRREFERLKPGLFEELFVSGLMDNKYLGRYGRAKIMTLNRGLGLVEDNRLTIDALLRQLTAIDDEERLFITLLSHIRERIRNFYSRYSSHEDQQLLCREVGEELRHKRLLTGDVPERLFHEAILTIKTEAVYLHNLLPKIIADGDVALREDFLENSGLDRFYVEELEREYYELNGLDLEELYRIRKGLS